MILPHQHPWSFFSVFKAPGKSFEPFDSHMKALQLGDAEIPPFGAKGLRFGKYICVCEQLAWHTDVLTFRPKLYIVKFLVICHLFGG